MPLRLALNHQTAKLPRFTDRCSISLRLALNHQTANRFADFDGADLLRLALNHQTAKIDYELRP